ncbi:unnamed protein product [Urochloa humidicola]
MEVIPSAAGTTTFLKPTVRAATAHRASAAHKLPAPPGSKCAKAIADCGTMARDKPARHAGAYEKFPVPGLKRTKASAVEPALSALRKRMAAELGALHDLLRKAELLCIGKNAVDGVERRSEEAVEASIEAAPEAKRRKVSDLPKAAAFECPPEDKKEFVDICGGVSPVAIQKAFPVVDNAGETSNNLGESRETPEDKNDEFVDICDGVSPVVSVEKAGESGSSPSSSSDSGSSTSSSDSDSDSDSGSSSSSDSDSDSDSESDPDEPVVDIPVPQQTVVAEENGTSAKAPPEPASEVVQMSTEPEKLPMGAIPEDGSGSGGSIGCTAPPALPPPEAPQPPAQSAEPKKKVDAPRAAPKAVSIAGAIYRAKIRRQLLEMERAVVPDESIHERDLWCLRIVEYGRPGIMRQLGLYLKADA